MPTPPAGLLGGTVVEGTTWNPSLSPNTNFFSLETRNVSCVILNGRKSVVPSDDSRPALFCEAGVVGGASEPDPLDPGGVVGRVPRLSSLSEWPWTEFVGDMVEWDGVIEYALGEIAFARDIWSRARLRNFSGGVPVKAWSISKGRGDLTPLFRRFLSTLLLEGIGCKTVTGAFNLTFEESERNSRLQNVCKDKRTQGEAGQVGL
jgi:hypothetical protein